MVRAGYKQTEVGVIPEDWEVSSVESDMVVIDGDRGHNYPQSNDFLSHGYCLFLSAKNVTKNGFKFTDCSFISASRDSLLRNGKLCINDIILTTRGTVGNFALFDSSVFFEDMRINSGMVILRLKNSKRDQNYIYLVLN